MPPISTTCTLKTTQHTLSAREAEHRGFDLDRTVAVLPSLPSCWCRRSPRNQCLRGCIPQCWHDSAGLDWGEGWGPSQFLFFDHHLLRFSFLQNHIFHIQFLVKTSCTYKFIAPLFDQSLMYKVYINYFTYACHQV